MRRLNRSTVFARMLVPDGFTVDVGAMRLEQEDQKRVTGLLCSAVRHFFQRIQGGFVGGFPSFAELRVIRLCAVSVDTGDASKTASPRHVGRLLQRPDEALSPVFFRCYFCNVHWLLPLPPHRPHEQPQQQA